MDPWAQRLRLPGYIWRHPANRGGRLSALARAFAFHVRSRVTRRPAVARIGRQSMWVHVGSTAATKVIYGSPPDWPEMQAWKRLLGPGDLFIDVGANVGVYSLWAANLGARVIAIEPDPVAASRLRENIKLNRGIDVRVVEAAATEADGTTTLTVGLDAQNRLGGERQIQAVTLDSIVGSDHMVHGIKIDVEGAERLVLEGAQRILGSGGVRVLQLEWNSAPEGLLGEDRTPVATLLRDRGFRFCRPDLQGRLHLIDPEEGYGPDIFAICAHPPGPRVSWPQTLGSASEIE